MVKKTDTKATTTVKKDTKPAAPAKQPAKTDAKKADNKKVDAKKVDNKKAVDTKKAVDNKKVDAKKVDAKKTDSKKVDPKAPKTVTKSGKVEKQQKVKKVKKNKFSKFANLFTVSPKNFGIGGDIQHKRDLTRFVRWPKYIRLQRQKRVLQKRLRIPPTINQFSKVADKNLAAQIIRFLVKYRPEDKRQKKERLRKSAELKKAGKKDTTKKPTTLKFGLNHVTSLIERQKASLVVIPHDVAPLEIVVWLPALCRKMDVPYAIVKSKSRLGQLVHQKKATCVALTQIRKEDKAAFNKLKEAVKINFANKYEDNRKTWGGSLLSKRSRIAAAMRKKAAATQ